jgi:hypothetical protein
MTGGTTGRALRLAGWTLGLSVSALASALALAPAAGGRAQAILAWCGIA